MLTIPNPDIDSFDGHDEHAAQAGKAAWLIRLAPYVCASIVTAFFAIRFWDCLPFSGSTRLLNVESLGEYGAYLIYADEPFTFPLGKIARMTFPFLDANIGSTGSIALFAIVFKFLGKVSSLFKDFYYFTLLDLVAVFLTAFNAALILKEFRVTKFGYILLGSFLTALSFPIIIRSEWHQPFCVLGFPIYLAWGLIMLKIMRRPSVKAGAALLLLLSVTTLVDNYTFVGLILMTLVFLVLEVFALLIQGADRTRLHRFGVAGFSFLVGIAASVSVLYVLGMYPLPEIPLNISSFDFGMGGGYHVADLLAPFMTPKEGTSSFPAGSILSGIGFPFTTAIQDVGQYEGFSYIGTVPVALLCLIFVSALALHLSPAGRAKVGAKILRVRSFSYYYRRIPDALMIGVCAFSCFIFSLGYVLYVAGRRIESIPLMPAGMMAEMWHPLFNIRAPGRLAVPFMLFLVLLSCVLVSRSIDWLKCHPRFAQSSNLLTLLPFILILVHLFDVLPLLRPVQAAGSDQIKSIFTTEERNQIRATVTDKTALLIAPSIWTGDDEWDAVVYGLGYAAGVPVNTYYVARQIPLHFYASKDDISSILQGRIHSIFEKYGNVAIAVPGRRWSDLRGIVDAPVAVKQIGPVIMMTH